MSQIKELLLKIYYLPCVSKEKANQYQKIIRDAEWEAIQNFIPPNSKFLDVGCGSGYSLKKAQVELSCECVGVDPEPGVHGVGRFDNSFSAGLNIAKGLSEDLPFENNSFDVVFCSHVLEHVEDEDKSLKEMKRVLKNDGVLVVGMPTATMAWIGFFTELIFTTHHRFVNVVFGWLPFLTTGKTPFINLFIPHSHSYPKAKTILYDLKYYREQNWERIITKHFLIKKIIRPAIYPYPQYWQLFKLRKNSRFTSSIFFICSKE